LQLELKPLRQALCLALLLPLALPAADLVDPFAQPEALRSQSAAKAAPADEVFETEEEPELPAAELVQPALLAGPGYQVEPVARLHGFQARFRLITDYGELEAESVEILAQRIEEMPAVQALNAESVTAALLKSGASAVMAPLRAVAQVVQRPGETLSGLPRGVWRYFSERVTKIGARAKRFGARADQRLSHDGSAYRDADAPMAASRIEGPPKDDTWYGDVGDEIRRLAKSEAGYGRARRELAARLGIDPYSGNVLIRERLDRLAWAATAGKLGVGQAMGLLDPLTSTVLSTSSDLNRLVLELPPEDLRARNDERLEALGANEELRYDFLQFGRFSPSLQTALVDQLDAIKPSDGVDALLEIAMMAANEVEARFIVNTLKLARAYLGERAAGARIVGVGAILALDSVDGERVFALPVDRLSWTEDTARWFAQPALWEHPQRSLVASGSISMRAQRALSRQGWSLFERKPFEGSPPYPAPLDPVAAR
jgi:hypothetical protein